MNLFRLLTGVILIIHALIHLLGFAIAFGYSDLQGMPPEPSRIQGICWLFSALLFGGAAVLFFIHQLKWWIPVGIAIPLSQYLIILNWEDARAGTLANMILLFIFIAAWGGLQV